MNTLDHDLLDTILGGVLPTCTIEDIFRIVCTGDTGPFLELG